MNRLTRSARSLGIALAAIGWTGPTGAVAAPGPASVEPPAPQPSTAVQPILDEATRLLGAKDATAALKAGDRALASARAAADPVGEAGAEEIRARALEGLRQTKEAIAAWRAAGAIYSHLNDGPGQVRALAGTGILLAKNEPKGAEALFQQALASARTEARRPLAAALAIHTAGNSLFEQGEVARARQFWGAALSIREKRFPDSVEVAKSLYNLGLGANAQGELPTAEAYYRRALVIEEELQPNSVAMAQTLNNLGVVIREQGDLKTAATYYRRALTLFQTLTPDSMDVGRVLGNLGVIANAQGELGAAWDYFQRARAIFTKLEPNSLEAARMLQNLGTVTRQRGELNGATDFYQRALAMQEKIAPDSQEVAHSLGNLGNVATVQGNLKAAEAYGRRALAIYTKRAPNSLAVAMGLSNLGNIAQEQGALAVAKARYGEALAIQERLAPGSLEMANSLESLGMVAETQGDLDAAENLFKRALAIQEQWAPDSLGVANCLNNLGNLAKDRSVQTNDWGKMDEARDYYQRALTIQSEKAPSSLETAASLSNLANVATEKQEYAKSEELFRQALAMEEKLAPNSSAVVRTLFNLGVLANRQNDPSKARGFYQRALTLQRRLAPGSPLIPDLLFLLSGVSREQGDWKRAERECREAWDGVLRLAAGVSGDEARQAYGSSRAVYASRLVRAQIALGKVGPAFETLEQGRARALQQLLVERQLIASAVPGGLWSRYRATLASRDRAEQAISQASINETLAKRALATVLEKTSAARAAPAETPANPSAVVQHRAAVLTAARQLEESHSAYAIARLKADQLWAEVKKNAPRAFAPPLSLVQAEQALPAGVLFVAFSIGEERTELFLLHRKPEGGVSLTAYPVDEEFTRLPERVQEYRQQVTDIEADPARLTALGRKLFALLFPPASRPLIQSARRLLISPDGPLWELPFAALVTNDKGSARYLGTEKAITYTPSLSVFAQARREGTGTGRHNPLQAVAVGDPIFERKSLLIAAAGGERAMHEEPGERTALFLSRNPPARLPQSRREAEAIHRLYGGSLLLGEKATEAGLRQRIGRADVIHLATHGFLNPVRAMSSGVLLTVPEREPPIGETTDDGVLQAWEIYSQVTLKAELVVLSACETGRGENVAGEGIVGLTRALQYAGARSVVASQWKVADASTATLMVAFHQKLRQGLAKDEALRQAMAVVRQNPETAHPYYWAPFFLIGDPENRLPSVGRGSRSPQPPARRPHSDRVREGRG